MPGHPQTAPGSARKRVSKMDRRKSYLTLMPVLAMLIGIAMLGGCKSDEKQDALLPPPPGYFVHAWQRRQIAAADQDSFVIYRFEWDPDASQPKFSPYGRHHFNQIMDRVAYWPHPIVIEKEPGEPHVDAARRNAIITMLTEADVRKPETRVEIRDLDWETPYRVETDY